MASISAKMVAQEVLETVRKGKRPNLGKIIKKNGYAETTSTVPSQVTRTKSYQEIMNPVVKRMEKERERIMTALESKDLTEERYRDLVDGLDKITKNIQLLSGKATNNVQVIPISEVFTNGVQNSQQHEENSLFTEED